MLSRIYYDGEIHLGASSAFTERSDRSAQLYARTSMLTSAAPRVRLQSSSRSRGVWGTRTSFLRFREPWLAGCKAYRTPRRVASSANNSIQRRQPTPTAPRVQLPPASTRSSSTPYLGWGPSDRHNGLSYAKHRRPQLCPHAKDVQSSNSFEMCEPQRQSPTSAPLCRRRARPFVPASGRKATTPM